MENQQYSANQKPYKAGVSAVNIQIYNPTVSPEGQNTQSGYIPTGANYGNYLPPSYPPYTPQGGNNYYAQQSNNYGRPNGAPIPANSLNRSQLNDAKKHSTPKASVPPKSVVKKKAETPPPPPLTNKYIQTLENYLNSQNKELRFEAANQVAGEFRVHKTRRNDPQLTPLLNKILQDPYHGVRLIGLSAINSGHAKGNDETIAILKGMQSSTNVYNQDALLASKILLKMAGNKLQPKAPKKPVARPMPQQAAATQGQKLNVVSS